MSRARAAERLVVTAAQRTDLEAVANSPSLPHRVAGQVEPSRIYLAGSDGVGMQPFWKVEAADWYRALVGGYVLATVKEAFGCRARPGLGSRRGDAR